MKIAMDLAKVLAERARRDRVRARAQHQPVQAFDRSDAYAHAICDHLRASLQEACNEPQTQHSSA